MPETCPSCGKDAVQLVGPGIGIPTFKCGSCGATFSPTFETDAEHEANVEAEERRTHERLARKAGATPEFAKEIADKLAPQPTRSQAYRLGRYVGEVIGRLKESRGETGGCPTCGGRRWIETDDAVIEAIVARLCPECSTTQGDGHMSKTWPEPLSIGSGKRRYEVWCEKCGAYFHFSDPHPHKHKGRIPANRGGATTHKETLNPDKHSDIGATEADRG